MQRPTSGSPADDSSTWGPHFWATAHAAAARYPLEPTESQRQQYFTFYQHWQYVLPCEECRSNWSKVMDANPLNDESLQERESLCRWVFRAHNLVNEKLGKAIFAWERLVRRYPEIMEGKNEPVLPSPQTHYSSSFSAATKPVVTTTVAVGPESLSGRNMMPDVSLGIVALKTPDAWRNSMLYSSKPGLANYDQLPWQTSVKSGAAKTHQSHATAMMSKTTSSMTTRQTEQPRRYNKCGCKKK